MSVVYSVNEWEYERDFLDGRQLIDGDRVRVTFPDGSSARHRVVIVRTENELYEMGRVSKEPCLKANIVINYRGKNTLFPIVGMEVELIEAATTPKKRKSSDLVHIPGIGSIFPR
jgi:hypothetical protein